LRGVDFGARVVERKPPGAVDFRKRLTLPASRRPFELERIRAHGGDVQIAFNGKALHNLAAFLLHVAKIGHRALRCGTKLLLELATRSDQDILASLRLAFRDRPRAKILLGPERSPGMNEQHVDVAAHALPHQESRAQLRHVYLLVARVIAVHENLIQSP